MKRIGALAAGSPGRRRLLKALAAGGSVAVTAQTLPSRWTRPVTNMVILPAHAQMSVVLNGNWATAVAGAQLQRQPKLPLVARVLNVLVPETQASFICTVTTASVCIATTGTPNQLSIQVGFPQVMQSGSGFTTVSGNSMQPASISVGMNTYTVTGTLSGVQPNSQWAGSVQGTCPNDPGASISLAYTAVENAMCGVVLPGP